MKLYIRAAIFNILDEDADTQSAIAEDPNTDPEVLDELSHSQYSWVVFRALKNPNIESFHKLKTHKSWGKVFISFHIVFKNKNISLKEANEISNEIEKDLKKHFKKSSILIRQDSYDELISTK